MANEVEKLVSAPGTIILDGVTYLVNKPSERDVFSIFSNARAQAKKLFNPLAEAMDAIKDIEGITEEQKTALLLQAYKVKNSGEIPAEAISDYLISAKGCAFYAFILIRKNHPEVTLEMMQKKITPDNAITVFADLDEASGINMIHNAIGGSDFPVAG